jgi:hypothetical protein
LREAPNRYAIHHSPEPMQRRSMIQPRPKKVCRSGWRRAESLECTRCERNQLSKRETRLQGHNRKSLKATAGHGYWLMVGWRIACQMSLRFVAASLNMVRVPETNKNGWIASGWSVVDLIDTRYVSSRLDWNKPLDTCSW